MYEADELVTTLKLSPEEIRLLTEPEYHRHREEAARRWPEQVAAVERLARQSAGEVPS